MSREAEKAGAAGGADGLYRQVALLVTVGIVLGLGYNALGRAGNPPRGLPWIGEAKVLETLEQARESTSGTVPAAKAPVSDDPLAVGRSAPGTAEGLPEIPDVGRPIQIGLAAVKSFFDAGAALFVDAREAAEYAEGHVPGAVNLPFDESVTDLARLESLDAAGKPIIVYCGGGGCEVSIQLAGALIQAGQRKVLVYEGGFPEWEAARYPVASGSERGKAVR